jgi:FkbM family methyltransferase
MFRTAKSSMIKLVELGLKQFGLQIVRSETVLSYSLSSFLQLLKRAGFSPRHIVDVGANRGDWSKEAMRFFPDAHYTLVEPQDHLKEHVQDLIDAGKVSWINAGAGDETGKFPFLISDRDVSSSFAAARQEQCDTNRIFMVELRTLNEIASAQQWPVPEMVKIDAEGFDLKVLAGASDLFGKTEIFLVEAAVRGNYENTIEAVVQRMAAAGYRVMDFTDLHRSTTLRALWLVEVAFVRTGSRLFEITTSYD